jgi:O-antigen/teichoic acid export membrane protein
LGILLTRSKVSDIFIGYAVSAGLAVVISRQLGHKFMTNWQQPLILSKKLVSFAVPVAIVSIIEVLLMNTDIFLIKRLLQDNTITGLYISAANLARLPWYILGAFYMTLFPSISMAAAREDIDLSKKYLKESLRYLLIVIIPVSFVINGSASNLIRVFYSNDFIGASKPLSILVFGISLMAVFTSFTGVVSAGGKPSLSVMFGTILLPISWVSNLILIPRHGLVGAAMASTLAYAIGVTVAGAFVFSKLGNFLNFLSILRIFIASFAITLLLPKGPVGAISLISSYLGAIFVYMLILIILRELTGKDVDVLKTLLKQS